MESTCIVIPCYNESNRLDVKDFIRLYERNPDVHICFVNDGSTDNTSGVINTLIEGRNDRFQCINQEKNRGKGSAIRIGTLASIENHVYRFIGYLDADLSTPLVELERLIEYMTADKRCQMLLGSRIRYLGTNIVRNPIRHYVGRIFATCASLSLGLGVYDTQCGMKLFRYALAKEIFQKPFISRWLFDIELIFRSLGMLGRVEAKSGIIEIPLNEWIDKKQSKISLWYFLYAPFDLLKIFIHYRRPKSR